jgi:AcrR family transcriptional regulator
MIESSSPGSPSGSRSGGSSAKRTGRPTVTSRKQILAAAQSVIEVEGWQRLTLRRLAAELGIGTTTLYHHVRDREDLLVQLLGAHLGGRCPHGGRVHGSHGR